MATALITVSALILVMSSPAQAQETPRQEPAGLSKLAQSIADAVARAVDSVEDPLRPRWRSTSKIRSLWDAYERQAYENTRLSVPKGVDSVAEGATPPDGPPDRP